MARFVVFHTSADVDRAHYVANLIEGHWAMPAAADGNTLASDFGEEVGAIGLWTDLARDPGAARQLIEKLNAAGRSFLLAWAGAPASPEGFDVVKLIGEAGPDAAALREMAARMEGKRGAATKRKSNGAGFGVGAFVGLLLVASVGGLAWAMSTGLIQNPLATQAESVMATEPEAPTIVAQPVSAPIDQPVAPASADAAVAAPAEEGMEGGVRVSRLGPQAAPGEPASAAPSKQVVAPKPAVAGVKQVAVTKPATAAKASKPAAQKPALKLPVQPAEPSSSEAALFGPTEEIGPTANQGTAEAEAPKKRSLFGRIFGGDDKDDED